MKLPRRLKVQLTFGAVAGVALVGFAGAAQVGASTSRPGLVDPAA